LKSLKNPAFDGLDIPQGGFGVIETDPPWAFKSRDNKYLTPHRTVEDHYQTMKSHELAVFPVAELAAKDCVLFMWVTSSHLAQGIALASDWGFEYKSIAFIWIKICKVELTGYQSFVLRPLLNLGFAVLKTLMGMGFWTRQEGEICLLFTRGKPARCDKGVRQVIFAERREHSRKPDERYGRIERLCNGPYVELFARNTRAGWSSWGNEVGKHD